MSTTEVVWPSSYCLDGDQEQVRMLAGAGGSDAEEKFAAYLAGALETPGGPEPGQRAIEDGITLGD